MSGLEIIGLAAAVIHIAEVGGKLSVKLFTFTRKVKNAKKSIDALSQDIAATGAVLKQLGEALTRDDQLRVCSQEAIDTAKRLVEDTEKVFTGLEKLIDGEEKSSRSFIKGISLKQKLKFPFLEPKIEEVQANLERLKSSLLVILNVLIFAEQLRNQEALPILKDQRELIRVLAAEKSEHERRYENILKAIADRPESTSSYCADVDDPPVNHMDRSLTSLSTVTTIAPDNSIALPSAKSERVQNKPIHVPDLDLPDELKDQHPRIHHHSQLVQNLLAEIASLQYTIDYGMRNRMHKGVLDIHWNEWRMVRSWHDMTHFEKIFAEHGDIAKYWSEVASRKEQEEREAIETAKATAKSSIDDEHERKLSEAVEAAKAIKASAARVVPSQGRFLIFKDALNRTYKFPWDKCHKWVDMRSLIHQAFAHVEKLGPLVQQDRYDLVGPEEEYIMPDLWEASIYPGMTVKIMLWPPSGSEMATEPSPFSPKPSLAVPELREPIPVQTKLAPARKAKVRKTKSKTRHRPTSAFERGIKQLPQSETSSNNNDAFSELAAQLLDLIAEELLLDESELVDQVLWTDLGVDSLIAFTIIGKMKEELDVTLTIDVFETYPTVGAFREYLPLMLQKGAVPPFPLSVGIDFGMRHTGIAYSTSPVKYPSSSSFQPNPTAHEYFDDIRHGIAREMLVDVQDIQDATTLSSIGLDESMVEPVLSALRRDHNIELDAEILRTSATFADIRNAFSPDWIYRGCPTTDIDDLINALSESEASSTSTSARRGKPVESIARPGLKDELRIVNVLRLLIANIMDLDDDVDDSTDLDPLINDEEMRSAFFGQLRDAHDIDLEPVILLENPTFGQLRAALGLPEPLPMSWPKGVVQTSELSTSHLDRDSNPSGPVPSDLIETIRLVIAQELHVRLEDITDDTAFIDLGLTDSLRSEVVEVLRDVYDIDLDSSIFVDNPSLSLCSRALGLCKSTPVSVPEQPSQDPTRMVFPRQQDPSIRSVPLEEGISNIEPIKESKTLENYNTKSKASDESDLADKESAYRAWEKHFSRDTLDSDVPHVHTHSRFDEVDELLFRFTNVEPEELNRSKDED